MISDAAPDSDAGGWLPHLLVALLAIVLVVSDQWTKAAIVEMFGEDGIHLPVGSQRVMPVPVMGGVFHLRIQENTGGAFSVLSGPGRVSVLLLVTSFLALGFIGWYYWSYRDSRWMRIAFAFIGGGAVGNLIDRVRLSYVVDFIDVGPWPIFNLADSSIVVGMAILIGVLVLADEGSEKELRPLQSADERDEPSGPDALVHG